MLDTAQVHITYQIQDTPHRTPAAPWQCRSARTIWPLWPSDQGSTTTPITYNGLAILSYFLLNSLRSSWPRNLVKENSPTMFFYSQCLTPLIPLPVRFFTPFLHPLENCYGLSYLRRMGCRPCWNLIASKQPRGRKKICTGVTSTVGVAHLRLNMPNPQS